MKARNSQVLIRKDEPEKKEVKVFTQTKQQPQAVRTGEVVDVGPKITDLKPGDRIFFSEHAGKHVEKDLWILHDDEILLNL